jgi:hypothetical protein
MLDERRIHYQDCYSGGGLLTEEGGVDGYEKPHPYHLFRWSLGEVLTAITGTGLRLAVIEECP